MKLKVLLPYQVLLEQDQVSQVVAESDCGFFGILPHRRDCVATLVPGILTMQTTSGEECFVAHGGGTLLKVGPQLMFSARRAMLGDDLAKLRETVQTEYAQAAQNEQVARSLMGKLESGFLNRFVRMAHE